MNGLVSFIVINKDRKKILKVCLNSIFNQTYKNIEVILVDNASNDESVEMVKKYFPQTKIIQNSQNMMVSKSYNQGIISSNGEYLFCINNDVFLNNDYLEKVLPKFKIDRKIGSISGKLLNPQTKKIDSTGQFLTLARRAHERGYKQKERNQFEEGYVWGVSGACALYKKEMLFDIKMEQEYFDEDYQAYLEDLDLNWRAHNAGWNSYFTPYAIAYHHRGITGWKRRKRLGYLNLSSEFKFQLIKNRYSTFIKNENLANFIKHIPFTILYDIYLWIFLLPKKPHYVLEFIKDRRWIKKAVSKRTLIKKDKGDLRWLS
ncbi:MAG: glycosyltransferase family 2 protein [Candidatus Saelkia tenebricola]|nr:glycosyltransferase family 2 protein [Candidatus Saelkia tenebricola]